MIRRHLLLAALCSATHAAIAASQPPLVVVQGSAAAYDARRDDTAARIVVGRDELTKFGDATIGAALKRQSGVTVDASGAIAMRGLGKGYTQILINGDKAPHGFSVDALSADLIERIEISRTPTADQRAEAIAGTINIVLRKAGRRSARSARLGVSRSRGQPGMLASSELAEPRQALSWQLAATASDSTTHITWRNRSSGVDGAGRPDLRRHGGLEMRQGARGLSLSPTASFKLANGDTLALQTHVARSIVDKDGQGYSDTVLGTADSVVRDTQLTHERDTLAHANLEWVHRLAGESRLNLKVNAAQFERAAEFRQRGYSHPGQVNLIDRTVSGIRERTFKNSARYAIRRNDQHALVAGWDLEQTRRHQERHQAVRRDEAAPENASFVFDATINRLALYVHHEWNPSEHLALYLGLRAERIDLRTSGRDFVPVRRTDALLSPVAQLLWKLPGTTGDQVRVGASRTYKAPAATSLIPRPYTSTNNSVLNPDERGNPHLRPELAVGLDAAFERHWTKGAMFSIGGYLRQIGGVTRELLAFENGRWITYPANGGRASVRGVEFDTRLKLADLVPDSPTVDLRFNLTRNWSQVDDLPGPDNRLAEQLRLSSTLGLDYQLSARWSMGAAYSYKRGAVARTALARYAILGSRGELDAYALASFARNLKLRATVANALAGDSATGTRYLDGAGERQMLQTRTMPAVLRLSLEWSR